jgi:MoaA/NifB/PqqE/SkfB family radical SAM enzyme
MGIEDVDSHKLKYYPEEVARWARTGQGTPLHVEIGPTNRCNHHCSFCSVDWITHGKVLIDTDVLVRAIHSMADVGVRSAYFAGEGEPLLHKDMDKFVQAATSRGMKCSMSTNASMLTAKRLPGLWPHFAWVRFSLDAATYETHNSIHGNKDFERIIKNIRRAVEYKKEHNLEVEMGAQFIVMEENIAEMEDFADLMKDVGVDNVQFKPHHNHPKSDSNPTLYNLTDEPLRQRLLARSTDDFKVLVRSRNLQEMPEIPGQSHNYCYKKCYAYNFLTIIDANGGCYGCNIFYDNKEYSFGNIHEQSFEEIHTSGQVQKVIEKVAALNHEPCGNYKCRPHVLNEYLDRIKNRKKNDEFI